MLIEQMSIILCRVCEEDDCVTDVARRDKLLAIISYSMSLCRFLGTENFIGILPACFGSEDDKAPFP